MGLSHAYKWSTCQTLQYDHSAQLRGYHISLAALTACNAWYDASFRCRQNRSGNFETVGLHRGHPSEQPHSITRSAACTSRVPILSKALAQTPPVLPDTSYRVSLWPNIRQQDILMKDMTTYRAGLFLVDFLAANSFSAGLHSVRTSPAVLAKSSRTCSAACMAPATCMFLERKISRVSGGTSSQRP